MSNDRLPLTDQPVDEPTREKRPEPGRDNEIRVVVMVLAPFITTLMMPMHFGHKDPQACFTGASVAAFGLVLAGRLAFSQGSILLRVVAFVFLFLNGAAIFIMIWLMGS